MKYIVYHAINSSFGLGERFESNKDFKKVAILGGNGMGLEDVFRLTNHIEDNWENNPEILEVIGNGHRSTSVGDIVVNEHNEAYRCEMIGWVKLHEHTLA